VESYCVVRRKFVFGGPPAARLFLDKNIGTVRIIGILSALVLVPPLAARFLHPTSPVRVDIVVR
jgi:hypothetical protein